MSSNESLAFTTQVYNYLDKCKLEIALSITPAQMCSLPQFSKASPKIMSNTINIWKKKHHLKKVEKNDESSEKKSEQQVKITDITEETYKNYLIRLINSSDVDIRVCTEIRNYLDKKNILKVQSTDIVNEIDVDKLNSDYLKYKMGDAIAN